MGWVWKDNEHDVVNPTSSHYSSASSYYLSSGGGGSGEVCSTRMVVRSKCKIEEVKPGKFVRKWEKVGFCYEFRGRSVVGRSLIEGIGRLLEAANEMKRKIFNIFGDFNVGNPPSFPQTRQTRRVISIEGPRTESFPKFKKPDSGNADYSSLARDV